MAEPAVARTAADSPYATYMVGLRERVELVATENERQRQAALEQARQAAELLRARFGAARVFAFGSLVRSGLFDDRSDIDLAVSGIPPSSSIRPGRPPSPW